MFATIWRGRIVSDSALTTRINAARAAIGDSGEDQSLIRTLPRKGLRFVGAVREQQRALRPPQPEITIAAEGRHPVLIHADRPSIAVLPFANLSENQEQDQFANGLADEIITALSRCSRLFVTARSSSFAYKGRTVDIRDVGRDLGVRYVLDGSVRRDGDQIRFTAQLIDATSGGHIWADRFEGGLGRAFELQDQITEKIVATVEPKLQLAEIRRVKCNPASCRNPYHLLLRAQQCEYEFRRDSQSAALHHLEQALAIDPSYAPAMALAAFSHAERGVHSWMRDPNTETKDALRLASRAVELCNDDSNVFWMAGYAFLRLQGDLPLARELLRHSLELNPHSGIALVVAGEIEANAGNTVEAIDLIQRGVRLSSGEPRRWFIALKAAWVSFVDGQFDRTISATKRVLDQNPRSPYALRFLSASLAKQGRMSCAVDMMRRVRAVEPQLTLTELRGRLMFMKEEIWRNYSAALRQAGFPE